MPGYVLHAGATLTCSHGGKVVFAPAQARATVQGTPIATAAGKITVTGCPVTPASGGPCTLVNWLGASARVTAGGQPVLTQSVPPAGPVPGDGTVVGTPPPTPLVLAMQLLVTAT